ncbi:helix-turn-helix domain-containing protein [Gordonia insulae]|uniref:Acetoin dehydrogenase operon transcriptional activator AcoR n=1 Tax=Gordonia insulae TaxID=2420509 RepID=A0A3G8JLU3_9ACTN|nr:helix-turn-helix domain-containing protein [Gordonia insulae]AZG45170.1 Acetoin dehydrogenase operon transcriptional activator AcoR [Gordonia insulae]
MRQSILAGTDGTGGAGGIGDQRAAEITVDLPVPSTRAEVVASWQRVVDAGADADNHAPAHLSAPDVSDRRRDNPLGESAQRLQRVFVEATDDSDLMMGVFDADGVLLWRGGTPRWLTVADDLELVEGSRWDEESTATTAVSLVMSDHRATRLVGSEHYNSALHALYCAAAPIHHPRTGAMTGIVGLAGPIGSFQPSSTAFAVSMAALGEHEIAAAHTRSLADLRKNAGARLAGIRGPALLVDSDGWVADSRGCTAPDAVGAPAEGMHQFVPGIGACVASAVGRGWLLRPVGPASPIVAELDLRGEPSLTVAGDGDEWRTVLTRRHAQILLLLAEASESGLTSARLSRLIFGDTGHVVTVRAEMSRLRRAVGALLTSRPYRLAPGVTLHIATESTAAGDGRRFVSPADAPGPLDTDHGGKHRRLA